MQKLLLCIFLMLSYNFFINGGPLAFIYFLISLPLLLFFINTSKFYSQKFLNNKVLFINNQLIKVIKNKTAFIKLLSKNKEKEINNNNFKIDEFFLGYGFKWKTKHLNAILKKLNYSLDNINLFQNNSKIHEIEKHNHNPLLLHTKALSTHTLILGTTGAGKTTLFNLLITQAIFRQECVIVIDPKEDHSLKNAMEKAAKQSKRLDHYYCLDINDSKNSIFINPVKTYDRASEVSNRLLSCMDNQGSGANQSFKNYSAMAICAAISALNLIEEDITLRNLYTMVLDHNKMTLIFKRSLNQMVKDSNNSDAILYYNKIHSKDNKKVSLDLLKNFYLWFISNITKKPNTNLDILLAIIELPKEFYIKVCAQIMPLLSSLCSGNLNEILSNKESNSLHEYLEQKAIIYIPLYCMKDSIIGANLGKLIIAELCAIAGNIYQKDKNLNNRIRTSIFIDEASELVNESLVQLLNKSRGVNFALTLATQTYADLAKRAGSNDAAKQIIGNCNNLIAMRVKDRETAEVVTSRLPLSKIEVNSQSLSLSTKDLINSVSSHSQSWQLSSLFLPEFLLNFPNFEFVALLANGSFFKGIVPILKDE